MKKVGTEHLYLASNRIRQQMSDTIGISVSNQTAVAKLQSDGSSMKTGKGFVMTQAWADTYGTIRPSAGASHRKRLRRICRRSSCSFLPVD